MIRAKGLTFQVVIPGTSFSHGKTTVETALSDSESLEAYLSRIAKINSAPHLLVKLFSPNGTSFKPRGEFLIFLPKNEPVATSATNVATSATNVATSATNVALSGLEPPYKTMDMDIKDQINYRVLQSEHEMLKGVYQEAKTKVQALEKKIEDLHDENKQLIRSSAIKDDKHAVDLERAKLEMDREAKGGLSGLVGELTKDPDLLKMIAGFIKPDHPMFTENKQPALDGAGSIDVKYSDDKELNEVLKQLPLSLSQQEPATVTAIFLLVQEFILKPDTLRAAIASYIPDSGL